MKLFSQEKGAERRTRRAAIATNQPTNCCTTTTLTRLSYIRPSLAGVAVALETFEAAS